MNTVVVPDGVVENRPADRTGGAEVDDEDGASLGAAEAVVLDVVVDGVVRTSSARADGDSAAPRDDVGVDVVQGVVPDGDVLDRRIAAVDLDHVAAGSTEGHAVDQDRGVRTSSGIDQPTFNGVPGVVLY